jgi:hypothetical protein
VTIDREGIMLQAWATARNRRVTIVLVAVCVLAIAAAAVVGLSDNPPGLALAAAGCVAAVLAVVHPWRAPREFWILLLFSVVGFVALAVLHNVFEALAAWSGSGSLFRVPLEVLGAVAFVAALLLCPAGCLVGAVGGIVMMVRTRCKPAGPGAPA